MAQFDQLGAPYSIVMTTPALTVDDLVEAGFNFDPDLNEHFNGKSRFPRYTIGNDNTTITFTTTDKAAAAALLKGMEVAGVVLTMKGTYPGVSAGPSVTQSSVEVTATISVMRVVEAVEISNSSDSKEPAQFQFTLRAAAKESDGTLPTITFAFSAEESNPD